ncbi:putative arabinose efflux permease, MFS family [Promicromonospora umidemergens]|uniref:MFS transporter n=1 Tax=Promicromonospora umidemergens TaxID=629679 RepID=A0ABP8XWI6_9MICO|nr:MFS transporter [Promicromonospora umidemergens]MCP2286260.1 putative arabinose efflux permease, MFS family [Promicromonospora umidemergens]
MSAQQSTEAPDDRSLIRRIVAASMAGTVVEWYDFFLYATAAALVFNKVLMPETGNEYDAIIAAFVTYAVGFLARPLGGVIFGHIGDKVGRKHTLQLTILLIGVATVLMGCLPTFQQVGFLAPALLVVLRFVQGVALGGEWGGAVLLVAEHSKDDERARWTAWPQAGVPAGNLLATVVLYTMSGVLSEAEFLAWGWRVAFWLSAVVIVVGYYVRTRVSDAPIYEETKAQIDQGAKSYGVFEVIKRYPRGVLTGMGLRFAENILYYLVVSFSIVYLGTALGMDTTRILGVVAAAHAFHFVVILVVGRLADSIGRKPLYVVGAVLGATWCWFAFPAMDTRNVWVILAVLMAGLLFHAMMYAVQPAIMAEMFPTRMRYSGVSISYQVTSIVAGSLAPILAVTWLKNTGSWWPTAVYMLVASAITLVAALALRETRGASLHDLDAEDQARERALAEGRS